MQFFISVQLEIHQNLKFFIHQIVVGVSEEFSRKNIQFQKQWVAAIMMTATDEKKK